MTILIGFILFVIFLSLSLIHFYWGLGGKWGINDSVPRNKNDEAIMKPRMFDCFLIALGLLIFGVFILIKIQLFLLSLPHVVRYWGLPLIGAIFILRAVGEFKYVGFFKRIKSSNFAQLDTKYYSPLCLFIGIMIIILQLLT